MGAGDFNWKYWRKIEQREEEWPFKYFSVDTSGPTNGEGSKASGLEVCLERGTPSLSLRSMVLKDRRQIFSISVARIQAVTWNSISHDTMIRLILRVWSGFLFEIINAEAGSVQRCVIPISIAGSIPRLLLIALMSTGVLWARRTLGYYTNHMTGESPFVRLGKHISLAARKKFWLRNCTLA